MAVQRVKHEQKFQYCDGEPWRNNAFRDAWDNILFKCDACDGAGKIRGLKCPKCKGKKKIKKTDEEMFSKFK